MFNCNEPLDLQGKRINRMFGSIFEAEQTITIVKLDANWRILI